MRYQYWRHPLLWLAAALTTSVGLPAAATEHDAPEVVRWDRSPIRLTLAINQERLLQFQAPIQPGVPPAVAQKIRIQAIDDTVYITAKEPFDYARFQVREIDSGRIYLLDLQAQAGGQSHPIRIVASSGGNEGAVQRDGTETTTAPPRPSYGYMALTRFAAKQVYAPERLTAGLPGLQRVPLGTRRSGKHLMSGAAIVATPLVSWRAVNNGASLYVSAVRLKNATRELVVLDPRRIRGTWRAATFQHSHLAPAGQAADTTTVYLISDRPFREALPPWLN